MLYKYYRNTFTSTIRLTYKNFWQLGSTINATCEAQEAAVNALKDTFLRQNAARHNEMATLERDAATTK